MDRKPESVRSITHDMRNLLTAVRGHAELALRGLKADDPVREDVAHVVVVTAAVFELIDQLDGKQSSSSLMGTNLDSAIVGMRRLLESLMPDVDLEFQLGSDGVRVTTPKLRIERIVLNLAINARDAMEGSGSLGISTSADDRRATISVVDSGPGFTDAALDHLFESGFTTKGDRGGSGHGLFALKGIIDGAGGSIKVESTAGQGATVVVRLPLATEDAESVAGRASDDGSTAAVRARPAAKPPPEATARTPGAPPPTGAPTKPASPAQPGRTAQPGTTSKPATKAAPGAPAAPAATARPAATAKPGEPAKPAASTKPGVSARSAASARPGTPARPVAPAEPGARVKPAAVPDTTAKPADSARPGVAAKPGATTEPAATSRPASPPGSTTAAQPAGRSAQAGQAQPGAGSRPASAGDPPSSPRPAATVPAPSAGGSRNVATGGTPPGSAPDAPPADAPADETPAWPEADMQAKRDMETRTGG